MILGEIPWLSPAFLRQEIMTLGWAAAAGRNTKSEVAAGPKRSPHGSPG